MINIGAKKQIFIDGRFIKNAEGVRIIVHKPRKTGEKNIVFDNSSHIRIGGYNSVMFEDGEYKLWYVENNHKKDGIYICVRYARSDDGITWELPKLKLASEYSKSPNNIVLGYGAGGVKGGLGDGTCTVFIDPNDKLHKYKMVARHGIKDTMGLYKSKDGINWKQEVKTVLDDGRYEKDSGVSHLDSQNVIFWDDRLNKYVAYVRKNYERHGQFRTIARGESRSLSDFPMAGDMETIMQTDETDMQSDTEHGRLPVSDFYTNAAVKYPWAENAYFMFPGIYFKYDTFLPEFKEDKPRNAGPVDIRFASSRDGVKWDRHDRSPYVGLGAKDDFDAYSLYMLNGIVPGKKNEMYMYYMGTDIIHGWDRGDRYEERENRILKSTGFDAKRRISAISRLVIRRDGFTSVRTDYKGGEFTTPLLVFDGRELIINVDTSAAGILRIGIMDENENYFKGYSIDDFITVHTCNDINKKAAWKNGRDVSAFSGKPVKLHFQLVETDLYAFQFQK